MNKLICVLAMNAHRHQQFSGLDAFLSIAFDAMGYDPQYCESVLSQ